MAILAAEETEWRRTMWQIPPFRGALELAMVGMGCFWGAERKFREAPGRGVQGAE